MSVSQTYSTANANVSVSVSVSASMSVAVAVAVALSTELKPRFSAQHLITEHPWVRNVHTNMSLTDDDSEVADD
jgi:hypothetical protein